LIRQYGTPAGAEAELLRVVEYWDSVCGAVQVSTPDHRFDTLMNGWLVYQTLSCRVWGRSAVYQSGGAYGFRDQLQDVCALVHAAPEVTRDHLVRFAARQFVEGDVQHWWHPDTGAGVRTRITDDFLWLPYAACHYVESTGDAGVWDERIPFLSGDPLPENEAEHYGVATSTNESATLFEHCLRAVRNGWRLGPHGLPLIGTGDWNDGMNRVGVGGRGESVWLAWFLIVVLNKFAEVAEARGESAVGTECRSRAEELRTTAEHQGWDGAWYRRAYFDDGTPLGSSADDECRIDSIVQSWAVLSGVAEPDRAARAMDEVVRQLVRPADHLVLLFTPPFDQGPLQPGYIKGYVPGVRENGGQYTHAAAWVVKALAHLGRGDEAHRLFDLLNPVSATTTGAGVAKYKGEPYVVAADVYSNPLHAGRAGWTWYTGSAGWLYRVGVEDLLGIRREGKTLRIDPCIPAEWKGFNVRYRFRKTDFLIDVSNPTRSPQGVSRIVVDGVVVVGDRIDLIDDGIEHDVKVEMAGARESADRRKLATAAAS
jgi:cyclic beta-1,2-glucan synthetase